MKPGLRQNLSAATRTTSEKDTLLAARIMATALAQAGSEDDRLPLARAFCYRLMAAWWAALTAQDRGFPLRPLLEPISFDPLPEPAAASADSMGQAAASFGPEAAAYAIGLNYTSMLPATYRAAYGVYYTPPPLTERLIERATAAGVDWTTCRVLDPACGGGAFLAPVARRILAALPHVTPAILVKNVASRLRGFEIDPFAAWLSQVTLDAVMLPVCRKAGRSLPVVVTVCDSLKPPAPRDRFDLVIGNPPYGRVTLEPKDRARYQRSLYGHANLYGLFTDFALRYAKAGGVIAYVTPTSFLAGEYFKNLRALLAREAPPATVDFISLRKGVFEDVLQETLLATYRRGRAPAAAEVHEVHPDAEEGLQITATGLFTLPEDRSLPWLMPRTIEQAELIDKLRRMPHRLADWGYGVSTGPLVWNRYKKQLRSTLGKGALPLIWAESVTSDGRFVYRAAKKNHEPYFLPLEGDDWLTTREPCVLLQRTTAKEQTRRLIAAALPPAFLHQHGAVVIENHLNMLRPIVPRPLVSPAVLAAFINSGAADCSFRCVNGSVAVSAYELEALPLPDPAGLGELAALVKRRANRAAIDSACDRLYAGAEGESD